MTCICRQNESRFASCQMTVGKPEKPLRMWEYLGGNPLNQLQAHNPYVNADRGKIETVARFLM
jgi:hypothetical protein